MVSLSLRVFVKTNSRRYSVNRKCLTNEFGYLRKENCENNTLSKDISETGFDWFDKINKKRIYGGFISSAQMMI